LHVEGQAVVEDRPAAVGRGQRVVGGGEGVAQLAAALVDGGHLGM
jgi:hypothetical protein